MIDDLYGKSNYLTLSTDELNVKFALIAKNSKEFTFTTLYY